MKKYNKKDLYQDIIDFESGEISEERLIALFQYLVDTGDAWKLQGFYGRTAEALIEEGLINAQLPNTKER
jgi:hypothetical protein